MKNPPRPMKGQVTEGLLGLATVIGHLDRTKNRVRLATVTEGEEIWAEVALAGCPDLTPGDRVLVAKDSGMRHYVIGVLGAAEPATSMNQRVVAGDGSCALRVGDGKDERLQIQDPQGRLLFEYRPRSGTAVVNVPEGDLQIRAPGGNIDLLSGRALRLDAGDRLSLSAVNDLSLMAGGGRRGLGSSLRLAPDDAALTADRLSLRAALGDLVIKTTRFRGERLDAVLSRAGFVLDKLECTAGRIVIQAQNFYQRVENLHHTSVGRVRTLVKGTFDVRSRRLRLKSTEVAKIDGKEIHFG